MYFFGVDGLSCLVECTLQLSVCLCTENERCIRWLLLCYSPPCASTVLIGLTVKPLVSIYCVAVIRFLSGVRKGMAVSTITAVKAGLLFFSGPETARYAR